MTKPVSERESNLYSARVFLAEAQRRRGTAFSWTLLQWAANARRRAAACREEKQPDLFGQPGRMA